MIPLEDEVNFGNLLKLIYYEKDFTYHLVSIHARWPRPA
jgi:hypothetical protein